jgi:hypothetical protein
MLLGDYSSFISLSTRTPAGHCPEPLLLDSSLRILANGKFMKLPNGERADLGSKIEDYVLNPSHWEGRHKARVFESMLGITRNNQQVLREGILAAAVNSDDAEALGDNGRDGLRAALPFDL